MKKDETTVAKLLRAIVQHGHRIKSRYLLVVVLGIIWTVLGLLSPVFFTSSNLFSIAVSVTSIALLAIGQTFVILTAGIDLSVGSTLALTQVCSVSLMLMGVGPVQSALIGLGIGAMCGFLNGFVVTKGLPPFIVTLGTMGIFRGIALIITGGFPVRLPYENFQYLARGKLAGIFPIPVLIVIVLYVLASIVLQNTRFGLHIYAIGSNEQGAIYTGVRASLIKLGVYTISGMTAALAGLIQAARVISAYPSAGTGAELDSIAAVVIGGTSFFGGTGNILLTFVGAIAMGTLRNGSNLLGISSFVQQIVIGIIIIAVIQATSLRRS